jgi:hypothetical protein
LQGHHVKITVPLLAHKSSELRLYLRNKQTAASPKLQSVQDSASLLQRTKSIQPELYAGATCRSEQNLSTKPAHCKKSNKQQDKLDQPS